TGDIHPAIQVRSPKTGINYHIHRSPIHFYGNHNPEGVLHTNNYGEGNWNNTLTFDRVGGAYFSWAYAALNSNQGYRGFSFAGGQLRGSSQSYAWTVWVR